MADGNFMLLNQKLGIKCIMGDPNVLYILGLPNDLVVSHILPLLISSCDPLIRVVSNNVFPKLNLCGLTVIGDGLSQLNLNLQPFMLLNAISIILEVVDTKGWFENKVYYQNSVVFFVFSRYMLFVLPFRLCDYCLYLSST